MSDDDDSLALIIDLLQQIHDPQSFTPVLTGGGLVDDDHIGIHSNDGAHGQALTLTLTQVLGPNLAVAVQTHVVDDLVDALTGRIVQTAQVLSTEQQLVFYAVLEDLLVGVLEAVANSTGQLCNGLGSNVDLSNLDGAGGGLQQADDTAAQGGLTGAVLTDDGHEVALLELQVHMVNLIGIAQVGEDQIIDINDGFLLGGVSFTLGRYHGTLGLNILQLVDQIVGDQRNIGNIASFLQLHAQFNALGHVQAQLIELVHLREDLIDAALHNNGAAVHDNDLVSMADNFAHNVLNQHNGDAVLLVDIFDQGENVALANGVQHGGGLVADDDLGQHCVDTCDGNALLLTAGQLHGLTADQLFQLQIFHTAVDAVHALVVVIAQVGSAEGNILFNSHAEQLGVGILEHQTDGLCHGGNLGLGGIHTVNGDLTGQVALDEVGDDAVHHLAQGGLAGAGGTGDNHEVAFLDLQVDVLQNLALGVLIAERNILILDDGVSGIVFVSNSGNSNLLHIVVFHILAALDLDALLSSYDSGVGDHCQQAVNKGAQNLGNQSGDHHLPAQHNQPGQDAQGVDQSTDDQAHDLTPLLAGDAEAGSSKSHVDHVVGNQGSPAGEAGHQVCKEGAECSNNAAHLPAEHQCAEVAGQRVQTDRSCGTGDGNHTTGGSDSCQNSDFCDNTGGPTFFVDGGRQMLIPPQTQKVVQYQHDRSNGVGREKTCGSCS